MKSEEVYVQEWKEPNTSKNPSKVEKMLPYKCTTVHFPEKVVPSQRMEEKTGGKGTGKLSQPVRGYIHGV